MAHSVYVSSTFKDLRECRVRVIDTLRKMGYVDTAMEHYVAENPPPIERVIADVRRAEVYVGLFAWRYGSLSEHSNPGGLSFTELEYQTARGCKDCLIFVQQPKEKWPVAMVDADATRIMELRKKLEQDHQAMSFEDSSDLATAVSVSLYGWAQKHRPADVMLPPPVLAERVAVLAKEAAFALGMATLWKRMQLLSVVLGLLAILIMYGFAPTAFWTWVFLGVLLGTAGYFATQVLRSRAEGELARCESLKGFYTSWLDKSTALDPGEFHLVERRIERRDSDDGDGR